MSGKSLARLTVVVIVLIVGPLSLSGCGAAWISYSKESQAKQGALQIQRQQEQIKGLESDLKLAQAKTTEQQRDIFNLTVDKNNLVNYQNDLIDRLKKKGYKITLKIDGGYEIDDTNVGVSEAELESQAKEFGDTKKDKDKPSQIIGK